MDMQRLTCEVRLGYWGVMYGVSSQVLGWGQIRRVCLDIQTLFIDEYTRNGDTVLLGDFMPWSRKYVEVYETKQEALARFLELLESAHWASEG